MVKVFGLEIKRSRPTVESIAAPTPPEPRVVSVDDLKPLTYTQNFAPALNTIFGGDKFYGGFGPTQLQYVDYWTLRQRSAQLFNENLYARGLIRRLITNEINVGLSPESIPADEVLDIDEATLNDWTENVETRFSLWAANPQLCDYRRRRTFGAIQRDARAEALIAGDVLVMLRQSPVTKLPAVQLISGDMVRTPLGGPEGVPRFNEVIHGVEFNAAGRVVAYHIIQDDLTAKRVPAFGEKSGRALAWLTYGTDKRLDDVRGQPILSLVLQSLKEIDRYRDSAQRKAVINSILAMFIKKSADKPGTLPITGGAVRNDKVNTIDGDGSPRAFNISQSIPGLVIEELQTGEEPVGFHSQGIDLNFGIFEEAIIQSVAWANEVPPEILRLAFSNNYSASQAAINEFKIYLNKVWGEFGDTFCTPIYTDWLLSETLLQKISAPGLLEAWRDPAQYDTYGAWIAVEWYGSIKPSTDMLKQAKASAMLIDMGLTTHAREARILTGTKYSKNVKRLKRENEQLVEAERPIAEFKKEFGEPVNVSPRGNVEAKVDAVLTLVEDMVADAK